MPIDSVKLGGVHTCNRDYWFKVFVFSCNVLSEEDSTLIEISHFGAELL